MNILVIGNGFDLAHKLPTSYPHFLHFLHIINITSSWHGDKNKFEQIHLENNDVPDYIKKYIMNVFNTRQINPHENASNSNKSVQEIYDNLSNNIWYDYIWEIYNKGKMRGINWIDFEGEISSIIEKIDKYEENLYNPFKLNNKDNEKLKLFCDKIKFDKYLKTKKLPDDYEPLFRDFLDKSYMDLRRFVRCMEIYLLECVETHNIDLISQDIKSTKINAVLCFNYTHTFEKIYKDSAIIKMHYLHGETKPDDDIDSNNMVLGIDEYYNADEKNKHTNYNIYKKFTQRILNETGFEYRNWIAKMEEMSHTLKNSPSSRDNGNNFPNNVYIYGHSLDITDKDVLKDLIDRPYVKTTVFYHNKQQQTQQIANLVKMLGQDIFIKMINTVPQQICFVSQQPMKNK